MPADKTYLAWNERLNGKSWFKKFWVFWGIYSVVFYGVAAVYFFGVPGGWKIIILAVSAAIVARYVVDESIIYFYKKQHPYQRLNFNVITSQLFSLKDGRPDSWPSQHTSAAVAIGTIFCFYSLPWGLACFFTAIMLGIGRIILGYHDIWDVAGGWIVGLSTGFLLIFFLLHF